MVKAKTKAAAKPAKSRTVTKKKAQKKKVEPSKQTTKTSGPIAGDPSKVFDVARPGASMPSSSARPVIVSSKPLANDPMVTSIDVSDGNEPTAMTARAKKTVIQPLSSSVQPETDAGASTKTEDTSVSTVSDDAVRATTVSSDESQVSKTVKTDEVDRARADKDADTEEINELASQAAQKSEAAKEQEIAAQRAAEVEKMIASRKYFVPINAVKKRRTMRVVFVLLVIVLFIVVGLTAIDAGLIDVGFELPFDIL